MKRLNLKNWLVFGNSRNKFSRLDLDSVYTDNIYPLCVSLYVQFKKREPRIGDTEILLSLII